MNISQDNLARYIFLEQEKTRIAIDKIQDISPDKFAEYFFTECSTADYFHQCDCVPCRCRRARKLAIGVIEQAMIEQEFIDDMFVMP